MVVLLGSVAIVVACYVLVYYFGFKGVRCFTPVKLGGKTAIVTGGNTGIGKATALELAKRGSRVILACRNQKKAEAAVLDICRESGNNQVVFMQLDLASLQSVRRFAETILKTELRVDILINNAGDFNKPLYERKGPLPARQTAEQARRRCCCGTCFFVRLEKFTRPRQ